MKKVWIITLCVAIASPLALAGIAHQSGTHWLGTHGQDHQGNGHQTDGPHHGQTAPNNKAPTSAPQ